MSRRAAPAAKKVASKKAVTSAKKAPRKKAPSPGARATTVTADAPLSQATVSFDNSVFVNCPFDDDYLPLLHAMLFAIHDCGFVARFAVEDAGAAEQRIYKICRLIRESRLSIHDISRVTLSGGKFPRFNMPFECGIAYGAIHFDTEQRRDMLVLEAVKFRDQITLSDLAGTDPKAHNNDPAEIISAVRAFLARKKDPSAGSTRGEAAIIARYKKFQTDLKVLAKAIHCTQKEITSFSYLTDWVQVMAQWLLSR